MLVEEAAKLPAETLGERSTPNYEYGQSAVAVFKKKLMSEERPDIHGSMSSGRRRARSTPARWCRPVAAANPEAILNVTFGVDLVKFVREGNTRGLFKNRAVVSFLTGEPEYLDPLKEETPEGWIVTGYPWYDIKTPEHDKFAKAYQAKFNDYPRLGSIVGYQTIKAAAAILAKANSDDPEKMIAAAEGLSMPSPFGEITFRKIDHQSTLGAFVGKTAVKDGKGIMVNSVYRKGPTISRATPKSPSCVRRSEVAAAGAQAPADAVEAPPTALMVRDARRCRAPHQEGVRPHSEERRFRRVAKDEAAALTRALTRTANGLLLRPVPDRSCQRGVAVSGGVGAVDHLRRDADRQFRPSRLCLCSAPMLAFTLDRTVFRRRSSGFWGGIVVASLVVAVVGVPWSSWCCCGGSITRPNCSSCWRRSG